MVDDLTNTSYHILTCIEHIREHKAISIEGNANKTVQVIQRQREQYKFVWTIGGCGGRGRVPTYVREREREST